MVQRLLHAAAMRRILSLSSFLLLAAAGCGAQPEIGTTPPAAAAKASDAKSNDTAEAKAAAPADDDEAVLARAEAEAAAKGGVVVHSDLYGIIVCLPSDPGQGCAGPPSVGGGGGGRIGHDPIELPVAVAHVE